MKARLLKDGRLEVIAEGILESYALQMWVEKNHGKKITEGIAIDAKYEKC